MQALSITLEEVARELGVTQRHAARKCRLLAEKEGFPRPLPGVPSRFSRSQVEAWFASGGYRDAAIAAPENANESPLEADPVEAARHALEARYVHG